MDENGGRWEPAPPEVEAFTIVTGALILTLLAVCVWMAL